MPSSKSTVDRRVEKLDTIASVMPTERRDELADLLTDKDVETLCHLVNQGMGDNALRALHLWPRLKSSMFRGIGRWATVSKRPFVNPTS